MFIKIKNLDFLGGNLAGRSGFSRLGSSFFGARPYVYIFIDRIELW
jgi:hypothetical protein